MLKLKRVVIMCVRSRCFDIYVALSPAFLSLNIFISCKRIFIFNLSI